MFDECLPVSRQALEPGLSVHSVCGYLLRQFDERLREALADLTVLTSHCN